MCIETKNLLADVVAGKEGAILELAAFLDAVLIRLNKLEETAREHSWNLDTTDGGTF